VRRDVFVCTKLNQASLTVGNVIQFGKYKWRVLDVRDGKALLLAESIIEKRAYHNERTAITWEHCDLRKYLNGDFLNSFGAEKERIAQVQNANPNNQWFEKIRGGNSTSDRVFLLSIEEVVKYFGDSGQLRKRPKREFWISDEYNTARIARLADGGGAWWWWLRSPGGHGYGAAGVDHDGYLDVSGGDVSGAEGGVRPALWLNTGKRFRGNDQHFPMARNRTGSRQK